MKEELFDRLEDFISLNEAQLIAGDQISRKTASQLLISLSATRLGSTKAWNTVEAMFLRALEREHAAVKQGSLKPHQCLQKSELLTLSHALSKRRV